MFLKLLNRRQKWKLLGLSLMSLSGDALNLLLLWAFGGLCLEIAGGTTIGAEGFRGRWALGIFGLIILKGLSEFGIEQSKRIFTNDFTGEIRERLNRIALKVGPILRKEFHSAEIGMMTFGRVEFMNMFYSDGVPRFFSIGIMWLSLVFLMREVPLLALLTSLTPFLLFGVNRFFLPMAERANREEAEAGSKYSSCCQDGVLGIKTLKSFDAYRVYRELIQKRAEEMRKANLKFLKIGNWNSRVTNAIVFLYFILGSVLLLSAGGSISQNISGFLALLFLSELFEELTGFVLRRGKAKAAYDDIGRLIDRKTEDAVDGEEPSDYFDEGSRNEILFQNVYFEYGDGKPALSDVNFSVEKNHKVRLVGLSGGGKTTLLYLLSGLYRPTKGSVRILGRKVVKDNDLSIKSLCSAVWQDSYLFSDTVFENIRMASPTATREEVESAAKKANIHDLILSMPQGYDTVIGSGGVEISGGEAQRISIARAFLRDAPILLLDEVTSRLDRDNVHKVEASLKELMKGRTVFSVSHDLSRPEEYDEIFVVEDGRLIDAGTHEELISRCDSYYRLWNGGVADEA